MSSYNTDEHILETIDEEDLAVFWTASRLSLNAELSGGGPAKPDAQTGDSQGTFIVLQLTLTRGLTTE